MTSAGIYKITNLVDGKQYIGQSINIEQRRCSHYSMLDKNKHPNLHLQRAYNLLGKENFMFDIVLFCEKEELTRYEQAVVNFSKNIYNFRLECTDSNKGIKFSAESLERMRISHTGLKHTEEAKRKISEKNKGKTISEFQKQQLLKSHLGKPLSDEVKKKLSIALTGIKHSQESIDKVAATHTGMKRSVESRNRMSIAAKKRKAREALEKLTFGIAQ